MSLTDDWKTSKDFKSGKYFCRLNSIKKNKIVTTELSKFGHFNGIIGNYIEKVLIPCDYGYISELESKNKHLIDLQASQDKEVEKLRELLWECLSHLTSDGISVTPLNILLDKINEVLGNDK